MDVQGVSISTGSSVWTYRYIVYSLPFLLKIYILENGQIKEVLHFLKKGGQVTAPYTTPEEASSVTSMGGGMISLGPYLQYSCT
jgi:hypothetical protein